MEDAPKAAEPVPVPVVVEEKKGLVNGQEQINHLEEQVRKLEGQIYASKNRD